MNRKTFIFWSIFVVAAIFRLWQSFYVTPPSVDLCTKQTVRGFGNISIEPERKESGQVFIVNATELKVASTSKACPTPLLIRMKTKLYPRYKYGDAVTFRGNLSSPFNFKSDTGREFDYRGYLAKEDVYYEIKSAIVSANDDVQSTNIYEEILNALYSLKRKFVGTLEGVLGEPHAALASGLVVGEKAALGSDLINDFRTVGLIHIVVLSGYNITIVGDAMRRLLAFLPRAWGIGVGGIGIALFGMLVGGGATVVRSCFMAGIALSADLLRREYNVVRALAFAALVMLIQNPMILLHDPSFQLSFMATLGLILLASPIEKILSFIPEKFGARGIVASTFATQIFVSPYILYMMGQLSIIGVVVNILVLPFIPATMLFVALTGFTGMFIGPLGTLFGWVSHFLLSYELFMVENFSRIPFAALKIPAFSKWWVIGFYIVFFVVYFGSNFVMKQSRK